MARRATRISVALFLAWAGAPASAQSYRDPGLPLQAQLETWFRQTSTRVPGEWGIAVADNQGRLMWGVQPTRPMIPASTVKLLTTGFARSVVGSDARKTTRVVGNGRLDPGTGAWLGSWALEVNGDPTLEHRGSETTSLTDLATQLATRGIRQLNGPLAVTSAEGPAEARFPATWSLRHLGRLFAPVVGNLTIHDNVVSVTVAPTKKGHRVQLVGASPAGVGRLFSVSATTVAGRRSRLRLDARPDGTYLIAGTLGTRSRPRYLTRAASDTRTILAAMWRTALEQAGITWNDGSGISATKPGPATVLAAIQSPVFDSIASEINRRSLNLGAELMLEWAAGATPAAADKLTAHVQQVTGDVTGVRLVDGSGLSDQNRVSPWTFVSYLARFPLTPAGKNFPMLLPPNGSGTLVHLASGIPQRGVVRAKTGTLGNVATLVGYLGRPDGVLLISLMYNGSRVYAAKQAQWRLFRLLGAEGVVIPSDSAETGDEVGDAPTRE